MIESEKFISSRTICSLTLATLLAVMLVNVLHPFLWGPDEPREAEIARECLIDGHWIVPRFNQVPYVEKPPLYYDLAAAAFQLCGRFDPGAARMVSALLGILMLAAMGIFAWKKLGGFPALTAVAFCISMPQFYRAAHWILLDIGVGAFVTAALAVYGFIALDDSKSSWLHGMFFLCAAAAFLTKGTVTVVYLGIVILPFMIYKRRWLPCRLNWTLLFFLIPVGIWLWLFYREGGIYYLHEHFINNIFGRLLNKDLHLAGSPVTVHDVGHSAPWSFYLERLPNMFGAAIVLIPLILAEAYRTFGLPVFPVRLPGPVKKIWDFLTLPPRDPTPAERSLTFYLLCWTFVPMLFFSLPSIKEVTYILPSYAGLAILCARYLTIRIRYADLAGKDIPACLIVPCLLFAAAAQFVSPVSVRIFWIVCGLTGLWLLLMVCLSLRRKSAVGILLLFLSGCIGGVIIGNTPAVMRNSRLNRKCYDDVAMAAWKMIGNRPLYIFRADESIRGAMPFYSGRRVEVIFMLTALAERLNRSEPQALMMISEDFNELMAVPEFTRCVKAYRIERPDIPKKADSFVLLLSKAEQ